MQFSQIHQGIKAIAIGVAFLSSPLMAELRPAISMYGSPDLGPDFVSLPYANPNAPKGGTLILGEVGGFDSFCLLYTSPSPRDYAASRMPSSA